MNKDLVLKLLPAYIFIAVLLAFAFYPRIDFVNNKRDMQRLMVSFVNLQPVEEKEEYIEGEPVKVYIPSVGIEVGVIDGNYENTTNSWNVSDTDAQFAAITELPNNKQGNTLIYGHNTSNIFGPAKKLEWGDRVFVQTDNGRMFEYKYVSNREVKPDNVEVFEYEGEPRLTLVTCTGLFDENRLLMFFDLVSAR